jgi:iron(II)-dependent oxidoreductase
MPDIDSPHDGKVGATGTASTVNIISDAPEEDEDLFAFGFDAYARTIAEVIAGLNNATPLVIGIYGPWGSGKTTLMKKVKVLLDEDKYWKKDKIWNPEIHRRCKTVWFTAWKYKDTDEILAALNEVIFKTIKSDQSFSNRIKGEIEEFITSVDVKKGLGKITKEFLGMDVTDFIRQPDYRKKLGYYDTFDEFFERLIWTYTRMRPKWTSAEKPNDKKGALVVFIDDLDRCPRDRIIQVLETVKLFMDKPGCLFVIGAAEDILREAFKDRYDEDTARKFMDKIVQVTFSIPRISDNDFESYLQEAMPMAMEELQPYMPYILPSAQNNPRRLKRFINDLALLEGIHRNKKTGVEPANLMYWKVLQFEAPELVEESRENPEIINILRRIIDELSIQDDQADKWRIDTDKLSQVREKSVIPYLENDRVVNLVRNMDITPLQVRQLVSLDVITATESALEEIEKARSRKDMKPPRESGLGEMTMVPAGSFLYGDNKEEVIIEEAYEIDIYPVTNRQYKAFLDDNGYNKDEFWSKEGKKWRQEESITEPKYWADEKWNEPEHPVVGVSYYEAKAFANWAGKQLPSEKQWERAARGTDGREYPWVGDFDKEKCNSYESGIGKTTKVTRYPNGISPVGCYDMAGNVWEWTSSLYDKDAKITADANRVFRGGSWIDGARDCRSARRRRDPPGDRGVNVGFRLARSVTLGP